MKITKDTKLSEIIGKPGAEGILKKHSFPCVSCPFAKMEMEQLKLGEVCEAYGVDAEKLLKELNEKLK